MVVVVAEAALVEDREEAWAIRVWRGREVRREKEEVSLVVNEKALHLEDRERREKCRLKESRVLVVFVIGAAAMAVIGDCEGGSRERERVGVEVSLER